MPQLFLVLSFLGSALYGQNCVPASLLPGGSVSDSISGTSCTLSDGTPYAGYRLTLPVRGQAQFQFDPGTSGLNLILQDATGVQVASGASLQRPLEAGVYTILVNLPAASAATPIPLPVAFTLHSAWTAEAGMLCAGFASLGIAQTQTGVVGSSGCRLPDGTLYEAYTVNTFGAGNLTVSVTSQDFTPLLLVRGQDGSLLASDPASVVVAVDAGSQYQVVVATSDRSGTYQVTTSFAPAATETCLPQPAQSAPMSDKNSITPDSCSVFVDGMGDLAYYNYYNLTLTVPGQVDITAASVDFAATLQLLDASGNSVAIDTGGGAPGASYPASEIRMMLPAGSYSAEVFSNYSSGGTYTFTYNFTPGPPQPCPTGVLVMGTPAGGSLGASSCRTPLGISDIYKLTLPAAGALSLDLNSTSFAGQVAVRDSKDNLIVANQDVEGLGNSHISATLPAGSYTVVAGAISGSGVYQLASAFTPAAIPSCTYAQPLMLNGGYVQMLGPGSCIGANGQPMDLYQFTLPADSTIAAVMTSNQLDSYLALTDGAGNMLRSDDNSYGSNDPLIVQFLPAGTYQLQARAASSTTGGLYQVNLLASAGGRPAFCGAAGSIAPGGSISGTLSFTACQNTDGTFADVYQMTLDGAATIDLRLNSGDFDAYLELFDAKGNLVAQDDDSGGGTNARIQQALPAGSYYIFAKPFANYYSLGNYTLTLAGQ